MEALTIQECLDLHDDLTRAQYDLLHEGIDDRDRSEVLHPRVKSLRDLRLWLNAGIADNEAFDDAESRADRYHAALDD